MSYIKFSKRKKKGCNTESVQSNFLIYSQGPQNVSKYILQILLNIIDSSKSHGIEAVLISKYLTAFKSDPGVKDDINRDISNEHMLSMMLLVFMKV